MPPVKMTGTVEVFEQKVTKQFLDLEILYLLRNQPSTLYSFRTNLQKKFGAERSFGTIHPHLRALEKLGLIEGYVVPSGRANFPKRKYRITRKGRLSLDREVEVLTKMFRRIAAKKVTNVST
jgi:DNA-binding PadR family transcriptional regulator